MAEKLIGGSNNDGSNLIHGETQGSAEADRITNDASDAGRALGKLGASKGGKARAEKLTPDQRREIARKAVEARWAKVREGQPDSTGTIPREICSGVLNIDGIDLPCAVVDNPVNPDHPIRLFSQEGFLEALGEQGRLKEARAHRWSTARRLFSLPAISNPLFPTT